MKRMILPSELPINTDGSVFHLHLRPEQLSDKIIMMGDPERIPLLSRYLENIEFDQQNREFRAVTGMYKNKRITALSHGIGCDNIDIVVNELDVLVNVDLQTRTVKDKHKQLTMVRIGTCGGLQPDCPIGSCVVSEISMGMDGLLYFYESNEKVTDVDLCEKFIHDSQWNPQLAKPYFVHSDQSLVEHIGYDMIKGITCSASGFYGPQGRFVRLPLTNPEQNHLLESFEYKKLKVTNYEMESAALAGLSALMGHKAMTACLVIANRYSNEMNTNYKGSFDDLMIKVLERI